MTERCGFHHAYNGLARGLDEAWGCPITRHDKQQMSKFLRTKVNRERPQLSPFSSRISAVNSHLHALLLSLSPQQPRA
jgi:hypothetical protein